MTGVSDEVHQLLRQHGVQVTAQRLAIMRALSSRGHTTADELADDVRRGIQRLPTEIVDDFVAAWTKVMNLDRFDLA